MPGGAAPGGPARPLLTRKSTWRRIEEHYAHLTMRPNPTLGGLKYPCLPDPVRSHAHPLERPAQDGALW